MAWDPLGRLHWTSVDGSDLTWFQYDGTDAIEERSEGAVERRYVFGPGTDEPLVWYEGAGTSDRRWLHADERGSIVAVTDDAGTALAINRYDDYGAPGPGNLGRFGYTGQKWLPEVGLYDYKARMYAPALGRFLQTDPIGYGDGLNAYNYVGSDPVNFVDPSGLDGCPAPTGDDTAVVCGESGKSPPSGNQVNDIPRSFGSTSGPSASSQLLDWFILQEQNATQTDIIITGQAEYNEDPGFVSIGFRPRGGLAGVVATLTRQALMKALPKVPFPKNAAGLTQSEFGNVAGLTGKDQGFRAVSPSEINAAVSRLKAEGITRNEVRQAADFYSYNAFRDLGNEAAAFRSIYLQSVFRSW